MNQDRQFPKPGDRLIHIFRKRPGQVEVEVVDVDRERGFVSVRMGGKIYPTLSAAAKEVAGHASNGWVYWGLKKQTGRRRRRSKNVEG